MKDRSSPRFIFYILGFTFYILASSCSVQKQIAKSARKVITDSSLQTAHVGISIYEPATGKYWYNYNGDKYFVPASNTKLPTCYAAMKYLGDSLVGLRYDIADSFLYIQPVADPTFLHPDFLNQPVLDFLKTQKNKTIFYFSGGGFAALGSGWAWNDYNEEYMAERSSFPLYGNVVRFSKGSSLHSMADSVPGFSINVVPAFFQRRMITSNLGWKSAQHFAIERLQSSNLFVMDAYGNQNSATVPFTREANLVDSLLMDTLHTRVIYAGGSGEKLSHTIFSQPVDSLLRIMMHRSDNFFAEQTLLMVSNQRLGILSDQRVIDTLLKTDFNDLPQKPRWADGSGLSRYNLFSPQDMVAILVKMNRDFGMDRIRVILPTGGEGTLSNYYKAESGAIYAKTGTLSGVVALSGFLYTRKQKLLIFSVLVNNHQASATAVRRAVELFLQGIRQQY